MSHSRIFSTGVSVAMGTYNGERFLPAQLESLATQTARPRELVIGDDGSTDRTLAILETFASAAPFPVRILRNSRRLGSSENFLQTARRCSGEWIAFCDQDDVWLPHKLERIGRILQRDPDLVFAAHRATIVDEHTNPCGELNEPPVNRLSFFRPLEHRLWRTPFGFTEVFRSFLVQDFAFEDRPLSTHDRWIFWLANVVGSSVFLPDRLALYRRHQSNVSQFTHSPGLSAQLGDAAQHGNYEDGGRAAQQFSANLLRQAHGKTGLVQERVLAAAEVYARLGRNLRQRAEIWKGGRARGQRFQQWAQLLLRGGYRPPRHAGAGWQSAGKDLAQLLWPR